MVGHFAGRRKRFDGGRPTAGHTEEAAVECKVADRGIHGRAKAVAAV